MLFHGRVMNRRIALIANANLYIAFIMDGYVDTKTIKQPVPDASGSDTGAPCHVQTVWDLPVRIFHWSLASLFLVAWLTSEGDRWLDIHIFCGYAIIALIVFRLVWGFWGTHFARFKNFKYSPAQAREHLSSLLDQSPKRYVGHNPAGSWAIYLLLSGVFFVAISGLLVFGGEEEHGPASSFISGISDWLLKNIHTGLASIIMALVLAHIAGVLIESYELKEKLILSMINGRKCVPEGTAKVKRHVGIAILMVSMLVAYFLSAGMGLIPGKEAFESQFDGKALASSEVWQEECGACHMAYHPSLLPSRSWQALLEQQDRHFDEDLYLDEDVQKQLQRFASENSAEQGMTEPARKIMAAMDRNSTPLRITDTAYWKHKHEDIPAEVWAQSNVNGKGQCDACHSDAKQGWFEDARMRVPDAPEVSPQS